MKETIETLEYYRDKGGYCYELGDAHNPENPEEGNPESGIRFLNGKIEVWYKDATLSRDWSLDDQIAYVERYIAANEDEALIYEHKGDWKRVKCVIRQLNAIIPRVAAGEFDWIKVCGETIEDFVSPGVEEGEAWVEALKDQVAQYQDEINMIEAEVTTLKANNKKFDNEDEVVKMEEEVRAMVASKSASTKEGDAAGGNRVEEDNDSKSPDHKDDDASQSVAAEKDDSDRGPIQGSDIASTSATPEKGGTSNSAPKQDGSSKVAATQKDAAAKGAVIVFHEEMVKIEPRFVHHDTKKAKKGKGKAGGAMDEPPEKIMVISVFRRASYTSPTPSDKDTPICGDTGGQGMSTETDTDGEWTRTDMNSDDELGIPTVDEVQADELEALDPVTEDEKTAELAALAVITEEEEPAELDALDAAIKEEQRADIAATVPATGESKLAELLATAPVIEEEQRAEIVAPVPVAEAAKPAEPTHAPAPIAEEAKPTEPIDVDAEDEKGIPPDMDANDEMIPTRMDANDEDMIPTGMEVNDEKMIPTGMDTNDDEGSSTTYMGADDEEGIPTGMGANDEEGAPTDIDSGNEEAVPTNGDANGEEGTSTGMDADDEEGISTGMDADDEGVTTDMDSDDGGIPAETGSDADSPGQDAGEAEVAQAVENSPKLCRIFRRTVRSLVAILAEALPLMFFLLGLKLLVIDILRAHGYLESDL